MTDTAERSGVGGQRILRWWLPCAVVYGTSLIAAALRHGAGAVALVGFAATIPMVGLLVAIDATTRQLPRMISYLAFLVSLPLLIINPRADGDGRWSSARGAVVMLGITSAIHLLGRGALGRGDVHFSPLLGAVAGWFGLGFVVATWIATSMIGGLAATFVILRKRDRTTRFAYGPVLVFGLCAVLLTTVR